MKGLARLAFVEIALCDPVDRLGDALRRHRADRQAVGAGVLRPFAAQDHLKMRHGVAVLMAANSIESPGGEWMLAAGVEAPADLDVQSPDGFVHFDTAPREAQAQRPG